MTRFLFAFIFVCVLISLSAHAPALIEEQPAATSRAEQWRKLREEKALHLSPPDRTQLEALFVRFQPEKYMNQVNTGFYGLTPVFGGMETGSGFTLGILYSKNEFANGSLDFQATARVSSRLYQQYGLRIAAPRLANRRVFFDFAAIKKDYRQDNFYGIGPGSREEDRTNFRDESFEFTGTAGVRATPWLALSFRGGILSTQVGSGRSGSLPSIEEVFDPSEVPGLERQPRYRHLGFVAHVNYIDAPNPRAGGEYFFRWLDYNDRRFGEFSFRRYEVEVYQYIPFFNKRRVITGRAFVSLSDPGQGQDVPFNMMKTIGGSHTVRGFTEYRFRDRNFLLFNLEYRWEVFSALDMAVFADAGRVYPRIEDISLKGMEFAYGLGFRFNTAQGVFLRLDLGQGREGSKLFFKFGHVF